MILGKILQSRNFLPFTDDDVDGSFAVLKDAELRLINNLNNRFDSAIKEQDDKSIERFVKLYPLVGRREDGLTKYSKFLAGKVAGKGQQHLTTALKTPKDGKLLSGKYQNLHVSNL